MRALQATQVVFHHIIKSKQPISLLLEAMTRMAALGCIDKSTWDKILVHVHKSAKAADIVRTVCFMHQQVC